MNDKDPLDLGPHKPVRMLKVTIENDWNEIVYRQVFRAEEEYDFATAIAHFLNDVTFYRASKDALEKDLK